MTGRKEENDQVSDRGRSDLELQKKILPNAVGKGKCTFRMEGLTRR